MTKYLRAPPRLAIRVANRQTWILTDRQSGNDMGGVTYRHNNQGNHYQPWRLIDGKRVEIGMPLSQLGQAAQTVEGEVLGRTTTSRAGGHRLSLRDVRYRYVDKAAEHEGDYDCYCGCVVQGQAMLTNTNGSKTRARPSIARAKSTSSAA